MNKYIGNNKQDKCCLKGNNGTGKKQLAYFREFWKVPCEGVQAETCLKGWWKSAGKEKGKRIPSQGNIM